MAFGVQPTGFVRKRLPDILAEIEESARGVFGVDVVQTAQSPLGQLNGMMADIASTAWEIAEATYQSYDPDQAEGARLEALGRIRLLERVSGELDPEFRRAITNSGRARIGIEDIWRAASSVEGVTYAQVFENSGGSTDRNGVPSHAIAVAALGGDDMAIATAIRPYIVPGINAYGNTRVDIEVDGYCRSLAIVRPSLIALGLQLSVRVRPDNLGCPPPSAAAIGLAAANGLTGASRPPNGRDITLHLVRIAVARELPNVEVIDATVSRLPDGAALPLPFIVRFFEIASFDPANITVDIL